MSDAATDAMTSADSSIGDAGGTLDATTSLEAGAAGAPEGGTVLPANAPVRHSTITFQSLFDGNEDETSAAERLTQATFSLYLADPRDACPGGLGPPPPPAVGSCRGSFNSTSSEDSRAALPRDPD